jgi:hypothetical protein
MRDEGVGYGVQGLGFSISCFAFVFHVSAFGFRGLEDLLFFVQGDGIVKFTTQMLEYD